jgi:hypothetical protein
MWERLKHAFAIEAEGPAEPNEPQRLIIERLVREVVRRRLTTPALLTLELGRPLNYVSAQVLHFFQPILGAVTDAASYEEFTAFLERRGSLDYLSARIEEVERECERREGARERRDGA